MILEGSYVLPLYLVEGGLYQEVRATTGGTSGVVTCIRMSMLGELQYRILYPATGAEPTITVYENGEWKAEAWRTLKFEAQEVSEEFYNWITGNEKIYTIKASTLKGIGDAIRKKFGKDQKICVSEFKNEIENIKFDLQQKTLAIRMNGEYKITPDAEFEGISAANVSVNVPGTETLVGMIERSLTSIDIPDGTTETGIFAFRSCDKLARVTIPNTVTTLGYRSLSGIAITEMTIPDSVTLVDGDVFLEDTRLQKVEVGTGIKKFNGGDFTRCTALKTFICHAETPPAIQTNTFQNVPVDMMIYVPEGSVEAYKSATNWNERAEYIKAISGNKLDGAYRFNDTLIIRDSYVQEQVVFTSGGKSFNNMIFSAGLMELIFGGSESETVYVGYTTGWADEAYKTVTFEEQYVSDEFYTWFIENAVRTE